MNKKITDRLTANVKNILSLLFAFVASAFIGACLDSIIVCMVLIAFNCILYFGFNQTSILATTCGLITKVQRPDCTNLNTNGVEAEIYLANKSDIASITIVANVVTAITMVGTKKFWAYEGKRTSANHKQDTVVGKFQTSFKHSVTQAVFKSTGDTKNEIEALCNGLIVAITKNKYTGATGDSAYEIHGYNQGLIGKVTRDQADVDNVGAFILELNTPDGYTEPHLPYAFHTVTGTLAADDAAIAALQ